MAAEEKWHALEVVPNRDRGRSYTVQITIPEFTCVCPRTGLPDFGTMEIKYTPDEHLVELKSLKYYVLNYRNLGIFHEEATNRILDDLREAVAPRKIKVVGDFNPRGGIKTVVTACWPE